MRQLVQETDVPTLEIPRAPLLWVLVPQILGCLAGLNTGMEPSLLWAAGGGAFLVMVLIKGWGSPAGKCAGVWAVFFLSWGWMETREADIVGQDILELPPRAAGIEVEVQRVFRQTDKYGRVSGIGQVRDAPVEMDYLLGQGIYFLAYRKDLGDGLIQGARVTFKGIIYPMGWEGEEPDGFDEYLEKNGILFKMHRAILAGIDPNLPLFQGFCHRANLRAQEILRTGPGGDSPAADARVAMMLGDKEALEYDWKHAFKRSGTMHLFAISGLHVGILAMSLAFLLRFTPLPQWGQVFTGLGVLWLYVQVTGGQPSAIRAFIMAAIFWGGAIVLRKGSPFAALVASAVLVLAMNPLDLVQLGFQLSYAVVWVILLYGIPLGEAIQDKWAAEAKFIPPESISFSQKARISLKQAISTAFGICFAAMLASTPLMVGHFGLLVIGGILLNMLVSFAAFISILLGAASLLFGIFYISPVVAFLNILSGRLIDLMLILVSWSVSIPGYYYETTFRHGLFAPGIVVMLLALLALLQKFRPRLGIHFFWIPPVACAIVIALAIVPAPL